MIHAASGLMAPSPAGPCGSLLGAMILAALLRGKHEGLNRGNGDPPAAL